MANIYTSADQLIGKTPLLELTHIERSEGLEARILAKLEYLNPAGSVKDRIAKAMIDDAEAKGSLNTRSVIIEPTSGNTGIGLASVAAARGYRIILVMPDTMSVEPKQRSWQRKFRTALFPANSSTRQTPPRTAPLLARRSGQIPTARWISLLPVWVRAAPLPVWANISRVGTPLSRWQRWSRRPLRSFLREWPEPTRSRASAQALCQTT